MKSKFIYSPGQNRNMGRCPIFLFCSKKQALAHITLLFLGTRRVMESINFFLTNASCFEYKEERLPLYENETNVSNTPPIEWKNLPNAFRKN
jgi:hypothetical protein